MTEKVLTRMKKNLLAGKKEESETWAAAVTIDYPQEGEKIVAGQYAVRISATPDAEVELSINNGEWQGCRFSVGFYWFDWSPVKSGTYKLIAQHRVGKARWKKSEVRSCFVLGKGGETVMGPKNPCGC